MKTLRQTVSECMVRIHRIPPELADYHVRQMMPGEVKRRFLMYVRVSDPVFRVAKGAIGNLTINGMEDRAGKLLAHAGSREFPGECEGQSLSRTSSTGERSRVETTFRLV